MMSARSLPNHLGVDVKRVTDEAHFTDDLGADSLARLELMIVIEDPVRARRNHG
jgi:acyl carrier protein